MLPTQRASARRLHRQQPGRATTAQLRLVTDRGGREREQATGLLRTRPADDWRIRLVRARVLDAEPVRPIPIDQRAISTPDNSLLGAPAHD